MITINLRDFYPWYTHDEFVEVPYEVAAALLEDRRNQKTQARRIKRNKAQYSLDCGDGIENAVCFGNLTPQERHERLLLRCEVCKALNSLPEKQGRRIEAHFILGKSQQAIAKSEGVVKSAVCESIELGLENMRKILRKFF